MPVEASGHGYAGKDFFRALLVQHLDVRTYYSLRDTADILWANLKAESQATLEQCLVAVIDAMIGDYHDFNKLSGASISNKEEFDGFLGQLLRYNRPGPKSGPRIPADFPKEYLKALRELADNRQRDGDTRPLSYRAVADYLGSPTDKTLQNWVENHLHLPRPWECQPI